MTLALLDRIIVARLIEAPPANYPQPPFHYLLGCYARAGDQLRAVSSAPRLDAAAKQQLSDLAHEARAQVVQYASLLLSAGGVVPEVGRHAAGLPILPGISARWTGSAGGGAGGGGKVGIAA